MVQLPVALTQAFTYKICVKFLQDRNCPYFCLHANWADVSFKNNIFSSYLLETLDVWSKKMTDYCKEKTARKETILEIPENLPNDFSFAMYQPILLSSKEPCQNLTICPDHSILGKIPSCFAFELRNFLENAKIWMPKSGLCVLRINATPSAKGGCPSAETPIVGIGGERGEKYWSLKLYWKKKYFLIIETVLHKLYLMWFWKT